MKAKERVPEKCQQPKTLPAPSNEERKDELAAWQKEIVALAEARLSINGEQDVVAEMHRRAIGLCRIVEELVLGQSESEISLDALAEVMRIIEEDIQVARWITAGRPLNPYWF
jgi:hypothetical protein